MIEANAINSCRVCGSKNLELIISLGEQYVSNFVDSPSQSELSQKIPLDLLLCDARNGGCGLLQLRHTTPPELMYMQYWYKSGINQTMREALADITGKAEKIIKLSPGDVVVDIGANDGTLLRSYRTNEITTVGFEPARNLVPEAQVGTSKIVNDFFNYDSFAREFGSSKAKIITAIAMFYDLDNPNKFVADIVKCLDKDGVFIIQQNYLLGMLQLNAFDNIVHEHLEYYSLLSISKLLARHNLEVFDVETNELNGGSFRTYIRHKGSVVKGFDGADERVRKMLEEEKRIGLEDIKVYQNFAARINSIRDQLTGFIKQEVQKGKRIYIYGASTRGNTLLQYFQIDNRLIIAAAERNPDKWGKKTIGTLIPIISEEQARKERPDYFLVLPWHFLQEFLKREREYLMSGGKFIVPLPEFKVIGSEAVE